MNIFTYTYFIQIFILPLIFNCRKKNMGFSVAEERIVVAETFHMFVCSEANDG